MVPGGSNKNTCNIVSCHLSTTLVKTASTPSDSDSEPLGSIAISAVLHCKCVFLVKKYRKCKNLKIKTITKQNILTFDCVFQDRHGNKRESATGQPEHQQRTVGHAEDGHLGLRILREYPLCLCCITATLYCSK